MHDSGAKVYGPGESQYEAPGCYYIRSETIGDKEALFIGNLLVSTEVFKELDLKARSIEDNFIKIGCIFIINKKVEE